MASSRHTVWRFAGNALKPNGPEARIESKSGDIRALAFRVASNKGVHSVAVERATGSWAPSVPEETVLQRLRIAGKRLQSVGHLRAAGTGREMIGEGAWIGSDALY